MAVYGKINGQEIGFIGRWMHAASGSYEKLESTPEQTAAFLDTCYKTMIYATIAVMLGGSILIPTIATIKSHRAERNAQESTLEKRVGE